MTSKVQAEASRGRAGVTRSRVALLVALAIGAGIATPSPALAAGDQAMTQAMNRLDAGRKAFEHGQFEEALIAFRESNSLYSSPNSKLYIARCYRALGKVASAYTTYRQAAREAQDRLTATQEKRYSATRDVATSEGAELESKVPRLTLAVPAGVPEGFVVKANGEEVGKAGWGIATEIDPGPVTIEATGPRIVPFTKKITLVEGAQQRVDVEVKKLPTATVAVKLLLLPAGLTLALDETPIDVGAASTAHAVDVGEHKLVVTAPGYLPFTWTRNLVDTEAAIVEVKLAPDTAAMRGPSGTPKWLFFTVAGAAVATLAVGGGLAAHGLSEQSAQTSMDPYSRDPSTKSSLQTLGTINDVLFIGGGVLGAGAVALAFTTRWKSTDAATQSQGLVVSPWFTGAGAGFGAHGTF